MESLKTENRSCDLPGEEESGVEPPQSKVGFQWLDDPIPPSLSVIAKPNPKSGHYPAANGPRKSI